MSNKFTFKHTVAASIAELVMQELLGKRDDILAQYMEGFSDFVFVEERIATLVEATFEFNAAIGGDFDFSHDDIEEEALRRVRATIEQHRIDYVGAPQ